MYYINTNTVILDNCSCVNYVYVYILNLTNLKHVVNMYCIFESTCKCKGR